MIPLWQQPRGRIGRGLLLVASAAGAAAALRLAWYRPLVCAALLGGALAIGVLRWASRRKLRRLLRSGDVYSVLERWSPSLERVPHSSTMAPLMTATAFAAYGWVGEARAAMAAAERGPAWDAALEHRLFLDALLLAFEGDQDGAVDQAGRLLRLPLPEMPSAVQGRVVTLRTGVSALARAFAHRSLPGDQDLLERASESSPLVFWAMRYAAAVVAIDRGDHPRARTLVEGAPVWPDESTFRAFHQEIAAHASVPSAPPA